jgi:hypothetical protein
MYKNVAPFLLEKIAGIEKAGLFKREREITSAQQAELGVGAKSSVLNMCANNYLGLANHPAVVGAAREALDRWGYGLASVRFICGTQSIHKELEAKLSAFLGTEDTILYGSCFDANGGLFETLLEENDPSFPTNSITPASSTASVYARPRVSVTKTAIWPISKANCAKPLPPVTGSLPPMASSPWMATSPNCPRSAI